MAVSVEAAGLISPPFFYCLHRFAPEHCVGNIGMQPVNTATYRQSRPANSIYQHP